MMHTFSSSAKSSQFLPSLLEKELPAGVSILRFWPKGTFSFLIITLNLSPFLIWMTLSSAIVSYPVNLLAPLWL